VLARVLLAQSQPDRALGLLERLDALAEAQGRTGSLIQIRALRALALQAADEHPGALTLLAETLELAAPEGYVRVFVDEGPPMAALLRSLLGTRRRARAGAGPGTEHLHRVIQAFQPATAQSDSTARAVLGLIEPLTDRELEVLRLLAAGRRNRDIAAELGGHPRDGEEAHQPYLRQARGHQPNRSRGPRPPVRPYRLRSSGSIGPPSCSLLPEIPPGVPPSRDVAPRSAP
jgi:hypothetical protein